MLPGSIAAFDRHPWFGALPKARRALLIGDTRVLHFDDLEPVYRLGDPPDGLYAVAHGQVRLSSRGLDDSAVLHSLLGPGEWFGALSVLDDGARPHDAISHGPSSLLLLSRSTLQGLIKNTPGLHHDIVALVCAQFRSTLSTRGGAMAGPRRRLLKVLLDGAEALIEGGRPEPLAASVTQVDLAALAGVSRHTANRILKSLGQAGILDLGHGTLRVLDLEALRAVAQAAPGRSRASPTHTVDRGPDARLAGQT